MDNYLHWSTVIANKAISQYGDNHIICSGWSPSGVYHIGNSKEAVTCHAINMAIKNSGFTSKFILVLDDFDPLDKIPKDLGEYSKNLRPYLGHPLNRIPDFSGQFDSYAEYFSNGAKEALSSFGIEVEFIKASKLYEDGLYDEFLEIYLNKNEELDTLFETISGSKLDSYISIICQNCGNMKTTTCTKILSNVIHYQCSSKGMYRGCEFEGKILIDSHEWKLKWRLDWPARQTFLNVTVEPSGKDHSVSGGSVDTSLAIHEKILNRPPPVLEKFGFITIKGLKISSSKGGALPANEIHQIIPIPAYLFLIYRSDLMKDINFNPASAEYGKLFDEYDDARRMSKGINFENRKSEVSKLSTAVLLAMHNHNNDFIPASVKFEELALIYQISLRSPSLTIDKLDYMNKLPNSESKIELENRLKLIDHWLSNFAPSNFLVNFLDEPNSDILNYWDDEIYDLWSSTLNGLNQNDSPQKLVNILREKAKINEIPPSKYYSAFYQLVIGNSKGPNAANLVFAIGIDQVVKRLDVIKNLLNR